MPRTSERQKLLRSLAAVHDETLTRAHTCLQLASQAISSGMITVSDDTIKTQLLFYSLSKIQAERIEAARDRVLSQRYLSRPSNHARRLITRNQLETRLKELFQLPTQEFAKILKVTPDGFRVILDLIKDSPVFRPNPTSTHQQYPVDQQLAVALHRLGSGSSQIAVNTIAHEYGVSSGTVTNYVNRVLEAVYLIRADHIAWPTEDQQGDIASSFATRTPFSRCIGVVDQDFITLEFHPGPRQEPETFHTLAVIDDQGCFRYVNCGWTEGAEESISWRPLVFGPQTYLVTSNRLMGTPQTVPLYGGAAASHTSADKSEFNTRATQTLMVPTISLALGTLKARFATLQNLTMFVRDAQHKPRMIVWVVACMVMHNILTRLGDDAVKLGNGLELIVQEEAERVRGWTLPSLASLSSQAQASTFQETNPGTEDDLREQVRRECEAREYAVGVPAG